MHRKDKFGFILQAATDLYLWSFPRLSYRSYTKEWTWMLSTVFTKALCNTFPAALPSGEASSQPLPPCQEPAQQLGGARQCAVGWGMESWAGPGAVSSCPDTAPAVQTLLCICWSTAVTASSSVFTHKQKEKAGPELLLHYSTPGCALSTSALRALAVLAQYWYCSGLMRKQLSGSARVASLMTQDWLYNLHLPALSKVSICLQGLILGSCFPSLPPLSFWGILRLFPMVSRVQRALESEPGTRAQQDVHADLETGRNQQLSP